MPVGSGVLVSPKCRNQVSREVGSRLVGLHLKGVLGTGREDVSSLLPLGIC